LLSDYNMMRRWCSRWIQFATQIFIMVSSLIRLRIPLNVIVELMFESCGIPCHIFCAMKTEYMNIIPSNLICKRWTKSAKEDYVSSIHVEQTDSKGYHSKRLSFG